MKTSSFASIIIASLSAGGAIAGYLYFKPNNLEAYLKWKGFTLASATDSDNLWKSIYSENEDSFSSAFPNAEGEDKWKVVKSYCFKALKKGDYYSEIDKASKWCIDNVQTVRGQMVKEGMVVDDLMTTVAQYKVATAVQGNKEFWDLIGAKDDTLKAKAEAYQSWCETSLKSNPNINLVQLVNNFCHKKPYSNFKDRLGLEKYQRLEVEEIEGKYDELKLSTLTEYTGSNTLVIIGGGEENWTENLGIAKGKWVVEKDKFQKRYKEYCDAQDKEDFSGEKDYATLFSEYLGLCAKKKITR